MTVCELCSPVLQTPARHLSTIDLLMFGTSIIFDESGTAPLCAPFC